MMNNGLADTNGTPKVILIEHDMVLRHLYESMIRNARPDAHMLVFSNGYEAWKEFVHFSPDLVVTDDYHDGLHGSVIVTWMCVRHKNCRVLWTTPDSMLDLRELLGRLQHEILPKPFQRREFIERLNRLLPMPMSPPATGAIPAQTRLRFPHAE